MILTQALYFQEVYPYFNRISWDMSAISHSVMMAAKSRLWHKGVSNAKMKRQSPYNIEFSITTVLAVNSLGIQAQLPNQTLIT